MTAVKPSTPVRLVITWPPCGRSWLLPTCATTSRWDSRERTLGSVRPRFSVAGFVPAGSHGVLYSSKARQTVELGPAIALSMRELLRAYPLAGQCNPKADRLRRGMQAIPPVTHKFACGACRTERVCLLLPSRQGREDVYSTPGQPTGGG